MQTRRKGSENPKLLLTLYVYGPLIHQRGYPAPHTPTPPLTMASRVSIPGSCWMYRAPPLSPLHTSCNNKRRIPYRPSAISSNEFVKCTGWPISWQTWVGLTLICAVPPCSAWADGKLAGGAEQVGKKMEHPKSRFTRRWSTL